MGALGEREGRQLFWVLIEERTAMELTHRCPGGEGKKFQMSLERNLDQNRGFTGTMRYKGRWKGAKNIGSFWGGGAGQSGSIFRIGGEGGNNALAVARQKHATVREHPSREEDVNHLAA